MAYSDPNRLIGYFTARAKFSKNLPKIYLDSRHDLDDPYHLEVYLVNNSSGPLDWVELTYPLLYVDSESSEEVSQIKRYVAVKPSEAVKVADFDEVYDSDFLHQLRIKWQAEGQAIKEIQITDKGLRKFKYKVFEWLSDEG